MWTEERIEIGKQLYLAIRRGQTDLVRSLCAENVWLVSDYLWNGEEIWLDPAAQKGNIQMIELMLDLGFNVDALRLPEKSCALGTAIAKEHEELARFLLARGANPNLDRALISALNIESPDVSFKMVKLLVEHGADINQLYPLYGDWTKAFTALDWATANSEIAEYLRLHGAKTAAELRDSSLESAPPKPKSGETPSEEVVAYFNDHFGFVNKRSQIEIVPTGHPIAIHAIEPGGDRHHLTLFTTGLSSQPMEVPNGQEEFALAELFMQLPGDWPYTRMGDPNYSWPMKWLRKMAQYPHDNETWLGGPVTIIANGDPPKPLGPNARFTAMLLLAEKSFVRKDGRTVRLYRVTPLYTEERDLELRKGSAALLQAFDRQSVPFIVDLKRPSVVRSV